MTISTFVGGDPAECRAAAHRLHRLAATVEATGSALDRRSHLPADEFGGLSGDAFRRRSAALSADATDVGEACTGLGRALRELSRNLDEIRSLMGEARRAARPTLCVEGTLINPPPACAPAHDHEVFRTVARVVERARELEQTAQAEWRAALARYADTAPPSPSALGGPLDSLLHSGGAPSSTGSPLEPPQPPAPDAGAPPTPLPVPGPLDPPIPTDAPATAAVPPVASGGTSDHHHLADTSIWAFEQVGQPHADEVPADEAV